MILDTVDKLEQLRAKSQKQRDALKKKILVCLGPGCLAGGSEDILAEFRKVLKQKKIKGIKLEGIKQTGCQGFIARKYGEALGPMGCQVFTHKTFAARF